MLLFFQGNLLVNSIDEGLNLNGARRLLEGQRPYVDFFGHASPGAYLYQAAVFRLFGVSIWTARVLPLGYLALQIALLFWLVGRFASRRAAWFTAAIYILIETAHPVLLTAHHRWDSSTFAFASIALALAGTNRGRLWWLLTGLAAASAIVATPTSGLVTVATFGWLAFSKRWNPLAYYLAGAAAGVAAVGVWMAANGMLTGGRFGGYLGFLTFMSRNYAGANATAYGYVPGGWLNLFEGSNAVELLIRLPIVICLALPALAPLVALFGWGRAGLQGGITDKSTVCYLAACQLCFVAYTLPRPDLEHLTYVSAFAYALAAIWIATTLPRKASMAVVGFFLFWSLGFVYQRFHYTFASVKIETPIGAMLVQKPQQPGVEKFLSLVHPGDTMLDYPFMPTLGFLAQSSNPTSFMLMQPGMMKEPEENALLADMRRTKPRWIMWAPSTREEFLRAFPSAGNLPHNFPRFEEWVRANYQLREPLFAIYELWELKLP